VALNIGSLNFGVDANTAGLKKAIQQLDQFQRKTNQVARSQSKGAQNVAKAMSRQETAIKKAFQQTLALQQQLRKAGAPAEQIARVSNAFRKLTREMTSGKVTAIQFARSQDAFTAKLGRSRRALNEVQAAASRGGKGLARMSLIFKDLETSAVLAVGPLSGIGARIRAISVIAGRGNLVLGAWIAGITLAVLAVAKLGAAVLRSSREFEKFQARFELATGSVAGGRREMNFVLKTAQKLGLQINTLGRSYSRLAAASRGTALEGQKTRDIFLSVSNAAAALRLSGVEVEGIFRAIEQMMSKGTVQAEELRGQLGERLPGAFRLAAKAMKVTTRELGKLLKAGEVISDDFLPKFAKTLRESIGDKGLKNVDSLAGATSNLGTAWTLFLQKVDRGVGITKIGTDALKGATFVLQSMGGVIDESGDNLDKFNDKLEKLSKFEPLNLTRVFENLNKSIDGIVDQTRLFEEVMGSMDTGIMAPELFMTRFKTLFQVLKLNTDEVGALTQKLIEMGSGPIPNDIERIAEEFFRMTVGLQNLSIWFDKAVARAARTKTALEEIPREMDVMRARLEALQRGPGSLEVFNKFTSVVDAYRERLAATNIPLAKQIQMLNKFRVLLAQIQAQTKANEEIIRQERDRVRIQERVNRALERASAETDRLRQKTKALAEGPASLRIYAQILEPLSRYEEQLRRAGVGEDAINKLLITRQKLLSGILVLQDNVNQAAVQSANAMGNALENVIVKGEKLGEVLRNLARELFRVLLRATLIDPLIQSLTSGFAGMFRGGGVGTQGAPAVPGVPAAKGASFTIPGSGGADNKAVTIFGKAGEEITVRRPDQMGGGMGGGITIQINAPGADVGTIERIREMVRVEMVPQIIQAATQNTLTQVRRPKFA